MNTEQKQNRANCCAQQQDSLPPGNFNYIIDFLDTKAGKIPWVSSELNLEDKLGVLKARLTIGRMNYKVNPGLYAVGSPDENSLVFVSANYKLSFDVLRKNLNGLNAWILVINTRGINVWCAAGKGTFGTEEILKAISLTNLSELVSHRKLIVPQLGAVGVAAHEVKKGSGFSVIYGPIRAADIKDFLERDMQATKEMRQVNFSFGDRLKLTPAEVAVSRNYLMAVLAVFLIFSGISGGGHSLESQINYGLATMFKILLAYLTGSILAPLLLPWLPGRSFSFKGFFLGLLLWLVLFLTGSIGGTKLEIIAWALLLPAIASFINMNFTGASNYTSLSGVKKEMRLAVPLQIAACILGTGLWILNRFI